MNEGLTVNKISVIEHLAYKNKAYVIVLQQTHCTIAHKLVIPNFLLAGSVLSKKHGLATFLFTSSRNGRWSINVQSNKRLSGYG